MSATGKTAEALTALFARAALLATQGSRLPVAFPEAADFAPPDDGRYIRVSVFPNAPRWEGVTDGAMDQGLLQVTVVWPKGQGVIAAANIIAEIKALFAKDTTLFNGSTRVRVPVEPWAAPPFPEEGALAFPVTIPWFA